MNLLETVSTLGTILQQRGEMLTTAESCTGGGIAQMITEVAGSSLWFERGFVTYSNQAKQDMLGVEADSIAQYGAVSEEIALAMAQGAIAHSQAQVSVATTGIAGPSGGTPAKPVGTVWFAWVVPGLGCWAKHQQFDGDRQAVRQQAVAYSLEHLLTRMQGLNELR